MIHSEDPFAVDPNSRDPVRRFRGRLAAGVTVVTSGSGEGRAGLTVSSLLVVEGEPGRLVIVIGPATDLWSAVEGTGRLVVHVCREGDRHLAETFAGMRPAPGGVFSQVTTSPSAWGPVIDHLPDRAYCSAEIMDEIGYAGLVTVTIDEVEAANLTDPLVYFRGRFRSLG